MKWRRTVLGVKGKRFMLIPVIKVTVIFPHVIASSANFKTWQYGKHGK